MPTHGSLTKAGKVRGQTPKVDGRKRVGTSASLRNKSNFIVMWFGGSPLR